MAEDFIKEKGIDNIRYALFRNGADWIFRIKLQNGQVYTGWGPTRLIAKEKSDSVLKKLLE